jgi:nitrogen regulatory protein PII
MKFTALVAIVSAEYESKIKKVAKEAGATGATILEAKGSGYEEKKSFFSLTFEGNHSFLLYILEEKLSKNVLKALKTEIENEKGNGLAFTMPISHIVGLDPKMLHKFEETIKKEEVL